jgi:hypothetical protein
LQTKLASGEKLLVLAEMCRKLETEEEKILPFYAETISPADVALAAEHGEAVFGLCYGVNRNP